MTSITVDVHAHVWLDSVEAAASRRPYYEEAAAFERSRVGAASAEVNFEQMNQVRDRLTDVSARLAAMRSARVDVQLVSVAPTQYHNWAGRSLAEDITELTNAGVAAHCMQAPGRLVGLGVTPLQHPDAAVWGLENALLTHGLKGIEISSHVADPAGGFIDLSDRRLDPLWHRACELNAVLFLHPWGCSLDSRLDRWYLANSVGQPVEHAVALSHLIVSGVLDRFPTLKLIAAHGGGYLPAFASRADHAWFNRIDARASVEPPSAYLRRIYFDSLVHTPLALRRLVETVGGDQVLMGSDFPFDMGEPDPVGKILEAGLPASVCTAVLGGNAYDLGLLSAITF